MQENYILSIKIENNNPVELNQLSISLNALGVQYDSFLRKFESCNYTNKESKLYIQKIEKGSIIIELATLIIPLIEHVNTVAEFLTYLRDSFNWFLGKLKQSKYNHTKQDLEQLYQIVNLTAKDSGSNMYINISGDVNNNFHVDTPKANAIQNFIMEKLNEKKLEEPKIFHKELMYWANASFVCSKKRISDKVIIEKIDKNPKNVVFLNDEDAVFAKTHNEKFPQKNWQDLAYIVDVEVCYIEALPKSYKILKLYKDDVFDPND
jgi:hypothetical protein